VAAFAALTPVTARLNPIRAAAFMLDIASSIVRGSLDDEERDTLFRIVAM
jgi:hypothetical protein